jgi:phospholipid-binding lipoprotein MlaA
VHADGHVRLSNQIRLVQFLDKRTELLDAKDIVDEASLDPYAFTRDAYLQRRDSLIRGDGTKKPADDGFEPADEDKVAPAP